jgi:hypothetical protein
LRANFPQKKVIQIIAGRLINARRAIARSEQSKANWVNPKRSDFGGNGKDLAHDDKLEKGGG